MVSPSYEDLKFLFLPYKRDFTGKSLNLVLIFKLQKNIISHNSVIPRVPQLKICLPGFQRTLNTA